ncbi:MAG: TrbI/VirB10 family protein [Phycisphaerae bacterium]
MTDAGPPPPPKQSPEEVLRAYPPRPGVRRLRGRVILMLVAGVGLIIAGRMIERLFNRHAHRSAQNEMNAIQMRPTEDMLERGPMAGLPDDYTFIPPPAPKSAPAPTPEQKVEVQPPPATPPDPEMLKRLEQMRKELEQAMDSPIVFTGRRSASSNTMAPRPDSTTGQFQPPGFGFGNEDLRHPDTRVRDFFSDASNVASRVKSDMQPPISPYEVKAGTIIPAALLTGINSDLPGDIIGQVTSNVYDSVSGRYLLIPQGSRLIGRYSSQVEHGHNRVLIAWQRLILPDGYSIALDAMPGTDEAGVSGMADRVDYHTDRLVGATMLSTLLALGSNFAANIDPEREELVITANTVAEQTSQTAQHIIERELSVQPTVTIRPGMAFNVLVNRDLPLKPYVPVRNHR